MEAVEQNNTAVFSAEHPQGMREIRMSPVGPGHCPGSSSQPLFTPALRPFNALVRITPRYRSMLG